MHRDDPSLIRQCLAGDSRAWEALVERYGRLVYSVARRTGMNEADSEDVFQAVFLALYRRLAHIRDFERLSSWLITTAQRESWRVKRRTRALGALEDDLADDRQEGVDRAATWERQHLVRQALGVLGGKCQPLLEALFLDPGEPDYGAIAARLGMKLGSIGPTRARCLEKLQRILVEQGCDLAPENRDRDVSPSGVQASTD